MEDSLEDKSGRATGQWMLCSIVVYPFISKVDLKWWSAISVVQWHWITFENSCIDNDLANYNTAAKRLQYKTAIFYWNIAVQSPHRNIARLGLALVISLLPKRTASVFLRNFNYCTEYVYLLRLKSSIQCREKTIGFYKCESSYDDTNSMRLSIDRSCTKIQYAIQ